MQPATSQVAMNVSFGSSVKLVNLVETTPTNTVESVLIIHADSTYVVPSSLASGEVKGV
jgi:hypothetical protein